MLAPRSPEIDFDTAVAVLEDVYLGRYVTVSLFEGDRGAPSAWFSGWLVRVERFRLGVSVGLRKDPDDRPTLREYPADRLVILREGFRRAGEAPTDLGRGPLTIQYGLLWAVFAGGDAVPDWDALARRSA